MKQWLRYLLQIFTYKQLDCKISSFVSRDCTLGGKTQLAARAQLISSQVGPNFSLGPESICSSIGAGRNCHIGKNGTVVNSRLGNYVALGPQAVLFNTTVGNHTYLAQDVLAYHASIGSFCSIGPRVILGHGDHPTTRMSTSPEFYSPSSSTGNSFAQHQNFEEFAPIAIGHDVWIGANAYIKQGITIGNGAIVASGAIVTKDVEAYSIVGGVPAKSIKKRFSEEVITTLLNLKWWEWADDSIRKHLSVFQKENLTISDLSLLDKP